MVDQFKKRKLISITSTKSYKVTKGTNYKPVRAKLETQLTAEMLRDITTDWDSLHGALLSTQNWPMFLRVPENHFEVRHWTCS